MAERSYADSALEDLLGVPFSQVNDARLYRGLDVLHAHKEQLCQHLLKRYQDWFGGEFEFLLYDVTSTYFEGECLGNPMAQRGHSRDNRPDCPQVCIGLVVTKRLAELMDGVLGVESSPDEGSVFWCELNSSVAPELATDDHDGAAVDGAREPAGARQATLLCVEDNQANMKLVEQLIRTKN